MSISNEELVNLTVEEILRRWPQSAQVFRAHALACVGCSIAPFCEVTAVADIYGISLDLLLSELQEAINKPLPPEADTEL